MGWIMTKLTQRHSVWTLYWVSYPTLLIYDEIQLLSWMQYDLWWNLWRNWHNVMVFGLHIGLHIQHCEYMTKSDYSSWMRVICDEIWKRHVNFIIDHQVFCSDNDTTNIFLHQLWMNNYIEQLIMMNDGNGATGPSAGYPFVFLFLFSGFLVWLTGNKMEYIYI
jgi:hypothetical protein